MGGADHGQLGIGDLAVADLRVAVEVAEHVQPVRPVSPTEEGVEQAVAGESAGGTRQVAGEQVETHAAVGHAHQLGQRQELVAMTADEEPLEGLARHGNGDAAPTVAAGDLGAQRMALPPAGRLLHPKAATSKTSRRESAESVWPLWIHFTAAWPTP